MKLNLCGSTLLIALWSGWIGELPDAHAQPVNAPNLSLRHAGTPILTVTGIAGANYEIQFASQLTGSNQWAALTNVFMSSPTHLLMDFGAPLLGTRFYRAKILDAGTNAWPGYSPNQLLPGEAYQFEVILAGITNRQTLVVNSATGGVWAVEGSAFGSGISTVSLQFTRLGPVTIGLDVIHPPTGIFPSGSTNSYLLVFTAADSGLFQVETAPAMAQVGRFVRDQALVGQTVAPQQLSAGERYEFLVNYAGFLEPQTLVVDSASSGWWVTEGGAINGIQAVNLQYSRQGPLSGRLEVIRPADPMLAMPASTNTFLMVFTATNGGFFQGETAPAISEVGRFVRDVTLVGLAVAPQQLTAGERYEFAVDFAGIVQLQTLVVNSATSGVWVVGGNAPESGMQTVTLQYIRLTPLSGSLVAIYPSSPGFPGETTNAYSLVFTSINRGLAYGRFASAMPALSHFVRDRAWVGLEVASQQLAPGETYAFTVTNGPAVELQTLVADSPTSGLWVVEGSGPGSGISTATLQYRRLGPLCGNLDVILPPSPIFSVEQTNTFLFVFSTTNSGQFQSRGGPAISSKGQFQRTLPGL